jgi:hypothetical protein
MDAYLSEYQCLPSGLKFTARIKQWWETLAIPAEAPTLLLEISKFLATGVLILATAVILLMAG